MQTMPEAAPVATMELLLFRLGGGANGERSELFGLNVVDVREIVAMPAVTGIAGAPAHVLGVVNIRGDIVQVIDLPSLAGCIPASGLNIMLVTDVGGVAQAFAVEAVEEIVMIDMEDLIADGYRAAGGLVSAIARIADGERLAQLIDVRKASRADGF